MAMSKEVERDVKLYLANDWDIKEETPEYVVLKRTETTGTGHVLVFLFLGWWTFGLANVIYWLVNRKTKKIMK